MKAYRFQAFLAIALLLLTAMPAAAQTQPADRANTLKIAIPGRFDDPQNMNIYAPGVSRSNLGIHQVVYEYFFYNNLQTGEFIPWLADLKDLQKYLGNDLTIGGIDAAKDLIAKTKAHGLTVQQSLDKVIAELNTVVATITPAKKK